MLRPTDRIDLHVHSRFSDGQDDPATLCGASVAILSICDHDTIRAYEHLPAKEDLPTRSGIRILPGVEVSARLGDEEIHILGYFPDGFSSGFREWIELRTEDRRRRVTAGVSALRNDGIPVKWADFEREVGDAVPCRSHVARCLIQIGWPRNPHRLYSGFMNRQRFRPTEVSTAEVIDAIHSGGGLACWAHPPLELMRSHGEQLVVEGMRGIEVHSPAVRGERRQTALALAEKHQLLKSGGTDFHGGKKKRVGWYRVTVGDVAAELLPSESIDRSGFQGE